MRAVPTRRRSARIAALRPTWYDAPVLDIRLIREQPDAVKAGLATVGVAAGEVDELLALDAERRAAIHKLETLKAERGAASKRIGALKDAAEREEAIAATRGLGEQIAAAEAVVTEVEARFEQRMLEFPNLPHPDVPVGPDETANVVVRTVGTPRSFDFTPRPHWELGETLGILDFERGAKVSGSRFYVMKGAGRAAAARAHHLDARPPRRRPRLQRGLSAGDGAARVPGRHGQPAEVRRQPLSRRRGGRLVRADRRGAGHQHVPRRDPRARDAAGEARRLYAVLPAREDVRRPRRARHQARPPVRQGRDGEVRRAVALGRGALGAARRRRGRLPTARHPAPRGPDVHGRSLLRRRHEVRRRALGAGLRRVARGELVLQLPRLPGPARQHPLPAGAAGASPSWCTR